MSVPLYEDDKVIGMVEYTDNLDHWDGSNWTCGGTGLHLGIGKLKDGRNYVCHGTQWEGQRNTAHVLTREEAQELVLRHKADLYEEIFGESAPVLSE